MVEAATKAGGYLRKLARQLYGSPGNAAGKLAVVKPANGQVTANEMILACNGYIEKLEPKINGYIMPINNFVLATEPLSDDARRRR